MGEDFNASELYYRTADGGEFKLLPIKPLIEEQITICQSEMLDKFNIPDMSLDFTEDLTIGECDELVKAIHKMEMEYVMSTNWYLICEMAKRYLYLLKEQDTESSIPNQITIFDLLGDAE